MNKKDFYNSIMENSVNKKSYYKPTRCYKNAGWQIRVYRGDLYLYKYFNPSQYEEAVRFCEELSIIRNDIDKVKELFILNT